MILTGKHGGMQAEEVLELRALYLAGISKLNDCHTEGSMRKRELGASFHSDTLLTTRPHLLIVVPLGTIFSQATTTILQHLRK